MKKIFIVSALLLLGAIPSMAQSKIPEAKRLIQNRYRRTEIVLPQVNGYNIYKADLHVHSIFSDAHVTPMERIQEAWVDGLDIIAITEHMEYRPWEKLFLQFTKGYNADKQPVKHINNNVIEKPADERGILADLNLPVELAKQSARKYNNLLVIPGIEVTRNAVAVGHYNALFTTDNNKIYDADPIQALRNARAQGAIITHNHPGWSRTSCDITETEQKAYDEGLIDGVEVANDRTFYPPIVRRCLERNLYMVAASDTHHPTTGYYKDHGVFRTMTFILAKENTAEAIREALLARRTLGYCGGHIIGSEELLTDLFWASVRSKLVSEDSKGRCTYMVTNLSSIKYTLYLGKGAYDLLPFGSMTIRFNAKDGVPKDPILRVGNMWKEDNKNIRIELRD
ncbi:MAG: histidinol-phosphatase [Alistipes sp.]|nr:histidinol-phosphatase [Alistipes sp.]